MPRSLKISLLTIGGMVLSIITVLGFILATFNNEDYRKSLIFLVDKLTDQRIEITAPFSCEISATPRLTAAGIKLFRPDTIEPLEFRKIKIKMIPAGLLHGQLQLKVAGLINEPKTLKWLLPKELLALNSVTLTTELSTDTSKLSLQKLSAAGSNDSGLALKITGSGLIEDFSAPQPFAQLDLSIKVDARESRPLQGYLPDKLPEMGPVHGSLRLIAISDHALAAQDIKLNFGHKDKLYLQARGQISNIPVDPKIINTGNDFHLVLQSANTADFAVLINKPLPEIGPLTAAVDVHGSKKRARIENFSGQFGKTAMTANLDFVNTDKLPLLTGKITIPTLFSDELMQPAVTSKAEPEPKQQISANDKTSDNKKNHPKKLFSRQPLPRSWLHNCNCNIQLDIKNVADFQKNLKNLKMTVVIDDGQLQIDPATFLFEGGYAKISFFIDDTGSLPAVKLKCAVDDLDLTGFLTSIDVDSPIAGKLTLHTQLSSQGQSLHDLAANLDGDFGMALENGVIPSHMLKLIAVDILGWSFSRTIMKKRYAKINCCILTLETNQGIMTKQAFIFDSKNLTITGTGTINLKNETYDLTIFPRKKGKFWAAVTPVNITGPLRDPNVLALPVKEAALLYGGFMLAPHFLLPAVGINYLWEMISKDGGGAQNPCLEYLHQQSQSQPETPPQTRQPEIAPAPEEPAAQH